MCEAGSSRKLLKGGSGEGELKSGEVEENENTVGKASLQEDDPRPKVAKEPPDSEDEEADSPKKSDKDDLAALDGDEEVGRRALGSSVRKVWGRESFSPVREVWGEEGFNERDDEEEAEQEEQEVDNNEVENQNEGSVAENEGRSIGKRNLRK